MDFDLANKHKKEAGMVEIDIQNMQSWSALQIFIEISIIVFSIQTRVRYSLYRLVFG